MRTHLRKIGNSRGLIIPAALLEACNIGEEVDMRIEGKSLVIEALHAPRQNWFSGYQAETDDEYWPTLPDDEENGEWEW